jgi:hypothetical protein
MVCATDGTACVFDETVPLAFAARLGYVFASLIREARNASFRLTIPDDFPEIDFEKFAKGDVDLRGANGEDGLSFSQIGELILANKANIQQILGLTDEEFEFDQQLIDYLGDEVDIMNLRSSEVYLEVYRSLDQNVSCVYGVIKDKKNKVIVVSFRGSQAPDFSNITHDWRTK